MDRDGTAGAKAGREGLAKEGEGKQVLGFGGTRDPRQAGEQGPASKDTKQAGRKTQERIAPL